jgi:hypothetical protein
MKMTVFWAVAPFSLKETDQHFRSAYCFHDQGCALMMEGVSASEMLFSTRRNGVISKKTVTFKFLKLTVPVF